MCVCVREYSQAYERMDGPNGYTLLNRLKSRGQLTTQIDFPFDIVACGMTTHARVYVSVCVCVRVGVGGWLG